MTLPQRVISVRIQSPKGYEARLLGYESNVAGAKGELLGYGDSWIYNFWAPAFGYSNFGRELARLGFDTHTFKNYAFPQRRLAEMWEKDQEADQRTIYGYLRQRLSDFADDPQSNPLPLAIVLGGGGNDVKDTVAPAVNSPLGNILELLGTTPPLNEAVLSGFLADMSSKLGDIIMRLHRASQDSAKQQQIPIIVHAYDHPFPDGRPSIPRDIPPLRPKFKARGYKDYGDGAALAEANPAARACMGTLIERLNDSYAAVIGRLSTAGIDVHFVRLAGTLEAQPDFTTAGYKHYWANELHPTQPGFAVLATLLDAEITRLQARQAVQA